MFTERLQVLIEVGQRERLDMVASTRGVSVATLVREAIEVAFPATASRRADAAGVLLAAEPMKVPGVDELLEELDDLRGRRG